MRFSIFECPVCKTKNLERSNIVGTSCSECKIVLHANAPDNVRQVRGEWKKANSFWAKDFEEFQKLMKGQEQKERFVDLVYFDIDDSALLEGKNQSDVNKRGIQINFVNYLFYHNYITANQVTKLLNDIKTSDNAWITSDSCLVQDGAEIPI